MRVRDENKLQDIRKKTLEIFAKEGFDGFSMQKLAKAAGVSPATSYIYFKDKEDLITQVWLEETKTMMAATLENFHPDMPFSEGLRIQWINRAKYYLKHPIKMDFMEQVKHSPLSEKCNQLMGNDFRNIMKQFVTNAIKRNELVKVPLEVYWSIAFAPLYTLVKFHISGQSVGGHKFSFNEKIMMQTLELVLKALKP
jgi:AcrR family transcriptional regulator